MALFASLNYFSIWAFLQCRRGKDDRKQNTLAPLMNRVKYYIGIHQKLCKPHSGKVWEMSAHRLNMELDLQSLASMCSAQCTLRCTRWLRPSRPPPPHLGAYTRMILVSQNNISLWPPCVSLYEEKLPRRNVRSILSSKPEHEWETHGGDGIWRLPLPPPPTFTNWLLFFCLASILYCTTFSVVSFNTLQRS